MSSILEQMGVEIDGLQWEDLAMCRNADPRWFFEGYEQDQVIAENVEKMCSACLVSDNCEASAIANKETGVWGGIYFVNGKAQEIWKKDD